MPLPALANDDDKESRGRVLVVGGSTLVPVPLHPRRLASRGYPMAISRRDYKVLGPLLHRLDGRGGPLSCKAGSS